MQSNALRTVLAAAVPVGLVLSAAVVWQSTSAAFTATASSGGNEWQGGPGGGPGTPPPARPPLPPPAGGAGGAGARAARGTAKTHTHTQPPMPPPAVRKKKN